MSRINRLAVGLLTTGLLAIHGTLRAQGLLPVTSSTSTASMNTQGPLLVGQRVPEPLRVVDSSGTLRSLLSYKATLEVLVVGFFSVRCLDNQKQWAAIARYYDTYRDWHVAFVAVQADPYEPISELQSALEKAKLSVPVVRDPERQLTELFKIERVPRFLIIDESGVLRYRGPLRGPDARQAMDAVIGHIDRVPNPEPADQSGCPLH